ncbi:nucleotidyltransferase family protein [Occallatibacter savannae]|uniref:nucleotidyltransferase domain-containing protein n=1 Tax=Occallatibacter savannae TaxID=1002691 RepID=UPI000D6961CD|nr:nucleotidyltransferase family protein [Occallatibacter savannae]
MQQIDRNTLDLLRAVATPESQATSAAIAERAKEITHWDLVIEHARRHGLLPILYRRVEFADFVPPEALQQMKTEFERNAFHCMTNAEELLGVLDAFQQAGIAAIPFKGVVLAASAYGDMTLRSAGDLDLLIRFDDLNRASQILQQRQYVLKTSTLEDGSPEAENYFEYHFERPADGMILELRWRLELTQPRYRHNLGLDWAWPRRKSITVAGADVTSLDPVCSLLVLCMHGSKHAWSRWIWVCDVAMLIESEPALDWEFARREARRVGLERCLALGVLLANLAGANVPLPALTSFEADEDAKNMATFFVSHIFQSPGAVPGGPVPYFLRILGFRDRMRCLFSPAILKPNERDRAAIKLPKALEPLYYVIRPFRILRDRSGK